MRPCFFFGRRLANPLRLAAGFRGFGGGMSASSGDGPPTPARIGSWHLAAGHPFRGMLASRAVKLCARGLLRAKTGGRRGHRTKPSGRRTHPSTDQLRRTPYGPGDGTPGRVISEGQPLVHSTGQDCTIQCSTVSYCGLYSTLQPVQHNVVQSNKRV